MVQFFRIIDEQADLMRGLISDLLDAGRIKTGTLSVAPEPTAVADVVDQARNTFLSAGGRHTVRIDLPSDLPRVLADRRRIVQVLNNLFSNASLPRDLDRYALDLVDAEHIDRPGRRAVPSPRRGGRNGDARLLGPACPAICCACSRVAARQMRRGSRRPERVTAR